MKTLRMGFEAALAFVKSKRSVVKPNPGFVQQLKEYEKTLKLDDDGAATWHRGVIKERTIWRDHELTSWPDHVTFFARPHFTAWQSSYVSPSPDIVAWPSSDSVVAWDCNVSVTVSRNIVAWSSWRDMHETLCHAWCLWLDHLGVAGV